MWCFIVDSVPRDFEYIQNVTVGRFLRTSRVCLSEVCTIRSVRRDHDETTSSDWVYVCVCWLRCSPVLCGLRSSSSQGFTSMRDPAVSISVSALQSTGKREGLELGCWVWVSGIAVQGIPFIAPTCKSFVELAPSEVQISSFSALLWTA